MEEGDEDHSRGPETIIWIVTARCNLWCKHCYVKPLLQEAEIPLSAALKVIREAWELEVEHLHFTGGEPLLREDWRELIRETLARGMEVTVFTNSTLVDSEVAAFLGKHEVGVFTSLDGSCKEVFEAIRGRGSWEKFLRGVAELVEAGVDLHINISVNEINWRDVGRAVRKAVELGASSISLIPTMGVGNALKHGIYVRPHHFIKALKDAEAVARELGITVSVWCAPFVSAIIRSPYLASSNCRDWEVMDITPSGRVVLCDVMNYEIAHVVRDGLKGAWIKLRKHPLFREVTGDRVPASCTRCLLSGYCRGGCFARAWLNFGDVGRPDPLCPIAVKSPLRLQ